MIPYPWSVLGIRFSFVINRLRYVCTKINKVRAKFHGVQRYMSMVKLKTKIDTRPIRLEDSVPRASLMIRQVLAKITVIVLKFKLVRHSWFEYSQWFNEDRRRHTEVQHLSAKILECIHIARTLFRAENGSD